MQRRFRLTATTDFQRVRRLGRSYVHPFIVLTTLPNSENQLRFGIITTKTLGKAVVRNRIRRWLRAALQANLPVLSPGWDVVLIARQPILAASYQQVLSALDVLLARAGLFRNPHEFDRPNNRPSPE